MLYDQLNLLKVISMSFPVHYQMRFEQLGAHLIDIQIDCHALPDQQLWLPVWIPGSYLVREFARHLEGFEVTTQTGERRYITKLDKNKWQIETPGEALTIRYRAYAFDLSVRGCYVDQQRIFINPAAVCLALDGQTDQPIALSVFISSVAQSWLLATALPWQRHEQHYALQASSLDQLYDSPLELSPQVAISFEAGDLPHHIAISGLHQTDMTRLQRDLQPLCEHIIKLFGTAPFIQYWFLTFASGQDYGGLEHQASTALITPRDDLPTQYEPAAPSTAYQRFLGLCSHEYFHAWLVKTIRPIELVQGDLHGEAYTRLLWVFEGFTSYYDDLMLLRAGLIKLDDYLALLATGIGRYWQNKGRQHQSLAESSFDAWIKYYRPDENLPNSGSSYYNQGALTALMLDIALSRHGKRLDDLVRHWYQQAQQGRWVSEANLQQWLTDHLGEAEATAFWQDYVIGTKTLPLAAHLSEIGITLTEKESTWPLGIRGTDQPTGVQINQVLRDSPAARAGLSAHDVVIAIDAIKATGARFQKLKADQTVTLHWFRRDELQQATLTVEQIPMPNAQLQAHQFELASSWLNGEMRQ